MIPAYINSGTLLSDIERIMENHGLNIIESNANYRDFSGHYNGSAGKLTSKLNTELGDAVFDIEDSLFVIYPVFSSDDNPSLSNRIIK